MNINELSKKYTLQIKQAVQELVNVDIDSLSVHAELEGGVYLSEEFSDTLCILITSQTSGRCYVVSAKINGEILSDFIALAL